MTVVGWTAKDDGRPFSDGIFGDSGPWVRWLPKAWAAVADPAGRHSPPPVPTRMRGDDDSTSSHGELIAWWTPLDHLLRYGLGWDSPGVGLARWEDLGRPSGHAILTLVDRWWGPYVDHAVAWYGTRDLEHTERTRRDPVWRRVWAGGSDPMHLTGHRQPEWPAQYDALCLRSTSGAEAAVMTPSYAGWYSALEGGFADDRPDGRSWRVDVVCRPLGWLGIYRRSRRSGRWTTGQHRWHVLGAAE